MIKSRWLASELSWTVGRTVDVAKLFGVVGLAPHSILEIGSKILNLQHGKNVCKHMECLKNGTNEHIYKAEIESQM